jgi:hypothetical protein
MGLLMLRLCELRDEHFKKLTKHDLCHFHDSLDKSKEYRSGTLISMMTTYTNNLYPLKPWIDPAGGLHCGYEEDPAAQYK